MSEFFRDKEYPNLIWAIFNGKTWDEYHQLFIDIAEFAHNNPEPIFIAFNPESEIPMGSSPLSHLKWTAEFVQKEEKILHMYAIVDKSKFNIGRVFADLAAKLFFRGKPLTVVDSEQGAYDAYHKAMTEQ